MSAAARVAVAVAVIVLVGTPVASAAEPRLDDYFSTQEAERHDRYRTPVYVIGFTALGVHIGVLAALGLGAARSLGGWTERVLGRRWRTRAALLAILAVVVPAIIALPLVAIRHAHDRTFGLATNTAAGALRDFGVATAFRAGLGALGAVAFVWVARRLRRAWPVVVAIAAGAFVFASVFLFPVVYEPAFNRFEPVDEGTRARVLELADRAGVTVDDVLVSDASRRTTTENAYVSGLGSTKRVVLYDTLLRRREPRQVDVVVAHELAHEAHGDVLDGALYGAGGVALAVVVLWLMLRTHRMRERAGADGPGDPAIVPFLALFLAVASLVTTPAASAISRHKEAAADRAAIRLTEDPDAAIALEVALARANLTDLTPNAAIRWAFFTHPTTLERIAVALDETKRQRD